VKPRRHHYIDLRELRHEVCQRGNVLFDNSSLFISDAWLVPGSSEVKPYRPVIPHVSLHNANAKAVLNQLHGEVAHVLEVGIVGGAPVALSCRALTRLVYQARVDNRSHLTVVAALPTHELREADR